MRPPPAAVLAAVVVAGCGGGAVRPAADHAPAPTGTTRYADERRGFEVTFPSRWMRARRVLTPALTDPREILSVGTVRPVVDDGPTTCGQYPLATLGRVGPRDVFLTIYERTNRASPEMTPGPPRLTDVAADHSELPACLGRRVPFETFWMPFRAGGRGFYASAAIGDAVPSGGRARLQEVLGSLSFRRTRVEDDRERGVRFSYPRPWRIYPFQLAGVQLPHQIALGTFDLEQDRPDANCAPSTALKARDAGGLLFVFEYVDLEETQKQRVPLRPSRFSPRPRHPIPYECFGTSTMVRWRETGSDRVFQAHLYGSRRWVEQALGILDSFQISRQGR